MGQGKKKTYKDSILSKNKKKKEEREREAQKRGKARERLREQKDHHAAAGRPEVHSIDGGQLLGCNEEPSAQSPFLEFHADDF